MKKNKKKIELIAFIIYPIIASIISLLFNLSVFCSFIIFLALPALYLSLCIKRSIKKTAIFSAVSGIPLILIVDYIAEITNQWVFTETIFPFKLFEVVTIEALLWMFLTVYFVIIFYEYFLDGHRERKIWHDRMRYLIYFLSSSIIIFFLLYFINPSLLLISYFYLWFGLLLLFIPVFIELFRRPNLSSKFFLAGAYFFWLNLIYEFTGLKLGWWAFSEDGFIGWVSILGIKFPFEEFLFFILLFAMAILAYYEFFDDDEK